MRARSRAVRKALTAASVLAVTACSTSASDDDARYLARIGCEDFVKDRLKSPGTADFSGQSEKERGAEWIATGAVDSQNTFGGVVRNEYVCIVTVEGESVKLVTLDGLHN